MTDRPITLGDIATPDGSPLTGKLVILFTHAAATPTAIVAGTATYPITAGSIAEDAVLVTPCRARFRVYDEAGLLVNGLDFTANVPESAVSIDLAAIFLSARAAVNLTTPPIFPNDLVTLLRGTVGPAEAGDVLTLRADGTLAWETPSGGPGGGVSSHGDLDDLEVDDHPQYLTQVRGDARYFTEAEVTALLTGKSDTGHTHDSRYYTEAEVDALLSGKSATGHTHANTDVTGLGTASTHNVPAAGDATAGEVVKGSDTRLTNARTPSAHATSHKSGGSDPIRLDELAAPTAAVAMNAQRITGVADPSADQDAATKAFVLANAGGAGAYEEEAFRIKAALLEPRLLRTQYGAQMYVVPDNETHYHVFSWNLRIEEANGVAAPVVARFENRDYTGGPVPFRDVKIYGPNPYSFGWWLDPTGVVYENAKEEYFRKLGIIQSRPTRVLHNSGTALTFVNFKPGPCGSMVVQAGVFDKAWSAALPELGDYAGHDESATVSADHNFVHQELRLNQSFLDHPIPYSTDTANSVGNGKGFDWGLETGQPASPNTVPVGWLAYVNLPPDFHGVTGDLAASAGYLYNICTVGGLPANIVAVDPSTGHVAVEADSEWLEVKAGATDYQTGWYGTETFDPTATRSMIFEYHHLGGTQKAVIGVGSGTGIAKADFTHAIEIDNGTIKVLHDAGAGQVSRTYTAATMVAGHTYRFQITFAASGEAFYTMQTAYDPTTYLVHPIGSRDWYDLMEGTRTATGAGHTGLRMKGSSGTAGTIHTIAWPRIANARVDAITQPGYLMHDDLGGLPYIAAYTSAWANINGRWPTRVMAGTATWSAGSGSRLSAYGVAHNNVGIDPFLYDVGVADVDITFTLDLGGSNTWAYHCFNWLAASNRGWRMGLNATTGFFMVHDYNGGVGTDYYRCINGEAWSGQSVSLGAGPVKVRIRVSGDSVKTWLDDVACHDLTISSRPWKTQTQTVISTYDDAGATKVVGDITIGRAL